MKNLRDLVFLICGICVLCSAALGATVTSKATGLWSAGSTWDSDPAIPVNGDTVIIDTGHEVTFDVDQSGFADGVDLTVTGTFTCSTGAGAYYLMCSADIDGAGTFQAGTSVTALPSTVKFTVDFNNGAFHFLGTGGLTVLLYCTEPTNTYAKLSAQEAAGQTTLSIDTDLTADWSVGDWVTIIDMNKNKDVEVATIDAIRTGPDELDIDIGDSGVPTGLAAQKESGAYVVLCNRNITVKGASSGTRHFEYVDDSYIGCEINLNVANNRISFSCDRTEWAGVTWTEAGSSGVGHQTNVDCTYSGIICGGEGSGVFDALFNDYGGTCSGMLLGLDQAIMGYHVTVSGSVLGCGYGLDGVIEPVLTGTGVIDNCGRGVYLCRAGFYYGAITNNAWGFGYDSKGVMSCTMSGNTQGDLNYCLSGQSYNSTFGSATEFFGYMTDYPNRGLTSYFESFDHDGVTNAFKAWCTGGTVTSQTASPPTGYTIWYEHTVEDTTQTYPVFRQFETTVLPGTAIEVEGVIRIADGEDLTGYAPALQIIDKFADPLVDDTAEPLDEDEIPEPDGGVEAGWQEVSVIWANSGDSPRTVIVRMIAWHDGGGDDVVIDEAWSIATYKDQINTLYDDWANDGRLDLILDTAAAGGGGATAEEVRIEMDDNSTQLAAIVTFVTEIIERLKRIWAYP